MATKAQDVAQRWFQIAWERKDARALEEVISPEHPIGLREIQRSFEELYSQFPDLKASIADQFGDGDKVVTRLDVSATHDGRTTQWMAIYIHEIKDGKITNVWRLRDAPDVSHPQRIAA